MYHIRTRAHKLVSHAIDEISHGKLIYIYICKGIYILAEMVPVKMGRTY
jgi:hypothetical protein